MAVARVLDDPGAQADHAVEQDQQTTLQITATTEAIE